MIVRSAETALRARLAQNPAVVLLGPRQVGKTTLARKLAEDWPAGTLYLDMERPADRLRLDDADAYLRQQRGKLVIIDEIHRVPGLFEILRGIIDDRRAAGERSGHFLLLGSAGIELMRQASESLAGRITVLEIQPLDVTEAATVAIATEVCWLRGGFPDSLLAASDADSLDWRRDFIRSYLERDVPMFAPAYRPKSWGDYGPCSPINRAACSIRPGWPAVSGFRRPPWVAISICWSISHSCGVSRPGAAISASA